MLIVQRDKVQVTRPFAGFERRVLAFNDKLMLVEHVMAAGSEFPRHNHPHEQLAFLVKGRLRVICNDTEYFVEAGDSFVVPGNVYHQVFALEDSVALDVFTPVREDYVAELA